MLDSIIDLNEAFNWSYDAAYDPEATDKSKPSISLWPSDLPGFKDGLYLYFTPISQFARRMTGIFALALGVSENFFEGYVKNAGESMRIVHCPDQGSSIDDQNGLSAHTDWGSFSVVTQDDCGGLEILNKSGYWIKAKPMPGSLVVNIADCLMRQTNDFFVSTVHRVVNKSGKDRYSMAYFYMFDREKPLEPVPTCVSEENPMKYPVMSSGEYHKWRVGHAKDGQVEMSH